MKRLSMLGRVLRALTIRIAYYVIALAISITAFAYADINPGNADLEGLTFVIAVGSSSNEVNEAIFQVAKADAKAKSTAARKIAGAVSLAAFAGAFILGERRTTVHHRHRRQG